MRFSPVVSCAVIMFSFADPKDARQDEIVTRTHAILNKPHMVSYLIT